jgi:hypothetical protein
MRFTLRRLGQGLAVGLGALALSPALAGAASITPNTTSDDFDLIADANCSVREAVQSAVTNAAFGGCPAGDAGIDTITLTQHLPNPYTLTIGGNDEDANAEGDLDVSGGGPIVIAGQGDSVVRTLSPDRVFDVEHGANLTLRGLVVADGDVSSVIEDTDARGGNIRAQGTSSLSLVDVFVDGGTAREGGGGIVAGGDNILTLTDSRIVDNTDENAGGGLLLLGPLSATITRSRFLGNSIVTNALGNRKGGGIRGSADNGVTITDSEISGNLIEHDGVAGADHALGGGLSLAGNATISRSLIEDNSVEGSQAERGGGIHLDGGSAGQTVTVVNSTIDDNVAGDDAGQGGGAFVGGNVSLALNHVTLSRNEAAGPEGDHLQGSSALGPGVINVRGSLITGTLGVDLCDGDNVVSAGFNVAGLPDSGCNFLAADSTSGGATGLAAGGPADNGGVTDTIALEPGGRAIDFVPAAQCGPAQGFDQRSYHRPFGAACDAGAYELTICSGVIANEPVNPCPPAQPAAQAPVTKKKKCKKKKKGKKGAAAAKKKKCKKKKKKK